VSKMKKNKGLKIAIVGATGLVGRTFLKVLEESFLPIEEIRLFATERSAGQFLEFKGTKLIVENVKQADFTKFDVALFSAGKVASKEIVPSAVKSGCLVIDNGSYWRMHPNVPLVVPEVNFYQALGHKGLIANPNCSTIQLVVALKPIKMKYGLRKVEVSTYQAISGAGQKGIQKLQKELATGKTENILSKHPIAFNVIFHSIPSKYNFSEEETKIINETKKILEDKRLKITATCVRIPVLVSHCESVSIATKKEFYLEELEETLKSSPGIKIIDEPEKEEYPTPRLAEGTDFVYIGRIRRNPTEKNGLHLWVVADNVRKGAASNAVQILEKLWKENPEKIFNFKSLF
jgi:aspartate-semialdehyde dehydrogenase